MQLNYQGNDKKYSITSIDYTNWAANQPSDKQYYQANAKEKVMENNLIFALSLFCS